MQDRFDLVDEDTGEIHYIELDSMVGDLRDFFMSLRRNQLNALPWNKLKEDQQKDEITKANEQARTVIYKLAEAIAEGGMQCAHVGVQKFGVDVEKGELTITAKGHADDEVLLDLVHSKGKVVKMTVLDPGRFNQRSKPIVTMPDQPSMFGEDVGTAPVDEPEDKDPDQDVEEMGAAMDADLDAMEEPEDLHEEPAPAEPAEATTIATEGYQARMRGDGPDDNPFDGGTDDAADWKAGYDAANEDIKRVTEEGAQAARDGLTIEACTWKVGSDAERFWMNGFNNATKLIEDDSHEQGRLAAELGHGIDVNPHPKKSTKRRLWDEGYNSFQKPE